MDAFSFLLSRLVMDRRDSDYGGWPSRRHGKGVVIDDGEYQERGKSRRDSGGKGKRQVKGRGMDMNDADFEMEMSDGKDPLIVLGSDLLSMVLSFLDALSVARSILVSRGWVLVASSDLLWGPMVYELWEGKAHLPRISMTPGISKLQAFSFSYLDGQRSRITKEDLCDHFWHFHFAKTAPDYWQNLDPYWTGNGPLMRRYFHEDGSVTADPEDKVWGGHECSYSIVTSFVDDNRIRQHYVRINRWPPLSIVRNEDWSWTMENQLCVYTTIPDPERPDGTGPLFPWY